MDPWLTWRLGANQHIVSPETVLSATFKSFHVHNEMPRPVDIQLLLDLIRGELTLHIRDA